ncbi:MAG: TIM barrel protein [Spirochaetes bacterium]|nr:TIM barrel protein [Spirochaetota bacterium]
MIRPGLVSISFRKLSPADLVDAARACGLLGIEWGGDVHVPHGDLARAGEVRRLTESAGLACAAYGSYYRAGEASPTAQQALGCARALGTRVLRVWAGGRASKDADAGYRTLVRDDLLRLADDAGHDGITVATEYHGGTLTDDIDSCLALLDAAPHPFLRTYWQPAVGLSHAEALQTLERVLPRLAGLHVYHWRSVAERLPLEAGAASWKAYLAAASRAPGAAWALLEFIPHDRLDALGQEAASLIRFLGATGNVQGAKHGE